MPVAVLLVSYICCCFWYWSDRFYCVVQVIGVTPKPAVVQTVSAVSDRGSQPGIQVVATETKKETPTTIDQVSRNQAQF